MKHPFLFILSIAATILLSIAATIYIWFQLALPTFAPQNSIHTALILDAGHGGEDGGAVSLTGVPESHINLAIVQKMDDILAYYGAPPLLLRRDDCSLHDNSAETLREKKVSDLQNRVSMIESVHGASLISIHQNTYPDSTVKGLQTFYAPTDGSEELAQLIQSAVRCTIQRENTREVKQIPKSVYLMRHVSCRAVLIECGFLSNREEEFMLRDEVYQKKLAAVLSSCWLISAYQGK